MNNYDEFLNFVLGSKGGGEQSVTVVEPLSISENGVYTASEGYAFSPVTVDVTSGGGGGITVDDIAMRTISGVVSGSASRIGSYAFQNCFSITTASFPACVSIDSYAFQSCRSLTTASFPACVSIGSSAFNNCYSLTTASFPACVSIGNGAFQRCYNLESTYFLGSSVPILSNNAFASTPIGGYSISLGHYGSVFVRESLYSAFIVATNWSSIASRIVSMTDAEIEALG